MSTVIYVRHPDQKVKGAIFEACRDDYKVVEIEAAEPDINEVSAAAKLHDAVCIIIDVAGIEAWFGGLPIGKLLNLPTDVKVFPGDYLGRLRAELR